MELKLKAYECLCSLAEFEINGFEADYEDFGDKYDTCPNLAEEYGCGNMKFIPKPATQEILDKYKISPKEYAEVCEKLDCLSFGSCGWCI